MKKRLKPITNLKKRRKSGFLKRKSAKSGRRILSSRRRKGRHRLSG